MCPAARGAMSAFAKGSKEEVVRVGGWTVAMRPVVASQADCVSCHNSGIASRLGKSAPAKPYKLGDVIGGVAYAYRLADSKTGVMK